MALSLYRKYRPATFKDVVGQDHIETTLKNAVQSNSVSHAYLFCGPRGTGKTTTARLLAKALLCEKAPTEQPDGTCLECQEIASGVHPDVYELDAASRTGVENVREEIIGRVQFAPTRGSYKIYIIDEVHMLSTAAFNALLKVIEEPPSHVIFVLCTTDAHKVPETIKSRCQQFEFHRLSEDDISARLKYICEQEGYTAEPEAVSLIAQRSQGGMRDAISSLEQVAVFTNGKITFEAAESLLGEVSVEQLFSVSTLLAKRNVAGCFAWVATFTQSGTDIAQFTRDLSVHIRNIYVASVLGNNESLSEIIQADDELLKRYLEQAAMFNSTDRLANVLLVLGDLSSQLRYSANARLALEIAFTRIARPESDLTLESLAARIATLEQGTLVQTPPTILSGKANREPKTTAEVTTSQTPPAIMNREKSSEPNDLTERQQDNQQMSPKNHAFEPSVIAQDEQAESIGKTAVEQQEQSALDAGGAHRLWVGVIKELQAQKKFAVASSLGGSSAHLDPKTDGLLIELPRKATFEKKNLERPENLDLVKAVVEKLNGNSLPLTYMLGTTDTTPTPPPPSNEDIYYDSYASTYEDYDNGSTQDITQTNIAQAGTEDNTDRQDTQPPPRQETLSFESILSATFGADVTIDKVDPND